MCAVRFVRDGLRGTRRAPCLRRTRPAPPPRHRPVDPAAWPRPTAPPHPRRGRRRHVDRADVHRHRQPTRPGADQRRRRGRDPDRAQGVADDRGPAELLRVTRHGERQQGDGQGGQGEDVRGPAQGPWTGRRTVQLVARGVQARPDRRRGQQRAEDDDRHPGGVVEGRLGLEPGRRPGGRRGRAEHGGDGGRECARADVEGEAGAEEAHGTGTSSGRQRSAVK